MESKKSFWLVVVSLLAVGGIHLAARYLNLAVDPGFLTGLRWYAIGALAYFGYQRSSLTTWILISMVVGMEVGVDFPQVASQLEVLSKIFIQLIKTVIAPLLLATLVVGIAGQSNSKAVGRMSAKAFTYFIIATSIALVIGLVAINLSKAGVDITAKTQAPVSAPVDMAAGQLTARVDSVKSTVQLYYGQKLLGAPTPVIKQDWKYVVLHIFPENIAKAVHEGAVLQIVVFSLIFGFALRQVSEMHRKVMIDWLESLGEVMFKFTNIIMYFAPFAVGGAMAYTIGTMGFDVVWNLIKLLGTLYAALIVFILLVFIPVLLFFKIPIKNFFRAVYEPASLAFATASSEAAFPKAMTAMENFGV
ncbi:MAG TPA: cation:dicarboxylase symporter family transporter, partial [Saprospiraceae bacterium]|nr:cation:dicarboxylase symporter family transporter [Saprospiraceae bacterium]